MMYDSGVQPTDARVAVYPLVPWGAGCVTVPGQAGCVRPYPPQGAGAAGGAYYAIGHLMNTIAPLWGEPADAFDQFDWNDPQTGYNALNLFGLAMTQDCGVPMSDPELGRAVGMLGEPGSTDPAEFYAVVRGLLEKYCPHRLAPPPQAPTTPGTPPANGATPATEEKPMPWGWIAAGAAALLIVGGVAIYFATKPRRRANPSRRRRRRRASASAPRRRRRRSNASETYQVLMLPEATPRRSNAKRRKRKPAKRRNAPKRRAAPKRSNAAKRRRNAPKARRRNAPRTAPRKRNAPARKRQNARGARRKRR